MIENVFDSKTESAEQMMARPHFAGSPSKNVYAYNFEAAAGNISNRRVFFHVDDEHGVSDSHALDNEAHIILPVESHSNRPTAEMLLPVRCVSCPGLAAGDLYITSVEEEPDKFSESSMYRDAIFRFTLASRGRNYIALKRSNIGIRRSFQTS
jgi:sugar lactone lactonase YvrE